MSADPSAANGDLAIISPVNLNTVKMADAVHAGNGDLAHLGAAWQDAEQVPPDIPAPAAAFSYSPASPGTGDMVTFDAAASAPGPGAVITAYDWLFNNSATRSGVSTTWRTPSGSGDYPLQLTVTNDAGASDTETQVLSI